MTKGSRSYRLFLESDQFPYTQLFRTAVKVEEFCKYKGGVILKNKMFGECILVFV